MHRIHGCRSLSFFLALCFCVFSFVSNATDAPDRLTEKSGSLLPTFALSAGLPVQALNPKSEEKTPVALVSCPSFSTLEQGNYCEQKRSADIAERAYELSVHQLNLSIFGAIVIAISLFAAIFSAIGALSAAKAANDGVKEQQINGKIALRAYLYIVGGEFNYKDNVFLATIKVENFGQSPAKNIKLKWKMQFRPRWNGGAFIGTSSAATYESKDTSNLRFIAPQSNGNIAISIIGNEFNEKLHDAMNSRQDYFTIGCVISWEDVFGSIHTVRVPISEFQNPITGLSGPFGPRKNQLYVWPET